MFQDRVEWIEYKNKEILYCDFKGLNDDDLVKLIKHIDELVVNLGKKDLLKINDVRGQYTTATVLPEIKRSSQLQKPFIKKSAYVGITGVKKVLLKAINRLSSIGAKPFTNIDEAKDWLIE